MVDDIYPPLVAFGDNYYSQPHRFTRVSSMKMYYNIVLNLNYNASCIIIIVRKNHIHHFYHYS